jgi:tRNA U54 and U55 pseudouridine synthase Pus10
MKKTKHIIYLSTNISKKCEHCNTVFGISDDFADSINHYIAKHGYKLLHIGTETSENTEGALWHSTVALLGIE